MVVVVAAMVAPAAAITTVAAVTSAPATISVAVQGDTSGTSSSNQGKAQGAGRGG